MSLVIDLPKETEEILEQEASKHGLQAPEYAARLIENQLPCGGSTEKRKLTGHGAFAGLPGSVDEFLRRKHEDTEREEQRWEERRRDRQS